MVFNTWDYCAFVLCPSFDIPKKLSLEYWVMNKVQKLSNPESKLYV
jgi:hypothetical protein